MELRCCIFAGGRPRVLSKFPLENPKKSNLNWVHGFHGVLEFFRDFAYGIALLHFCRREAQGTYQISLGNSSKINSELGTWISSGFGVCFGILLMELRCCIFARGRPRVLSKFSLKSPQQSNLNWVHGFPRVLEVFSGFCLWNCSVAFLQEGGPGYLANLP
jgi:hypothetical protein